MIIIAVLKIACILSSNTSGHSFTYKCKNKRHTPARLDDSITACLTGRVSFLLNLPSSCIYPSLTKASPKSLVLSYPTLPFLRDKCAQKHALLSSHTSTHPIINGFPLPHS
ncbi:hypothetical protein F5Y07DRAFT_379544 [Xylaria sp. FL0933]|nr:hypothetical protein F5Y07DRAFT_379544 [Xylaria sp. FL0933]